MHYSFSRKDRLGISKWSREFRQLVENLKPDILHSHLWPASRFAEAAIKSLQLPHIIHVHDTLPWLWETDWRSRHARWQTRKLFKNEAHRTSFLSVSSATEKQTRSALELGQARFQVVHNPVDPILADRLRTLPISSEQGQERVPLRIGTAGRLTPSKGQNVLIHAVARLRDLGFDIECHIAGEGGFRQDLERLVGSLGLRLGTDVQLLGDCEDIVSVLDKLDLFVLPSLGSEGLSIAQLEAMMAGLPVVITDVAGAKEAVRNEIEGLVVPPGDVDALTAALQRLLEEPNLSHGMGEAGRRRVENSFMADRMAHAVSDAYQQLTASRECLA